MPYLIQKETDGALVRQWDLRGKPLSVGRGNQVDAKIDDAEMSRQHFSIAPKGDSYLIKDLKSKNGTLVNGKKTTETVLKPNDRIRAGNTRFVFVDGLATVIGKLEKEDKGYSTYIREISRPGKRQPVD